jgi:TatD DNase family protein
MLIDTHCHLNDADAFPDVEAELAACHAAGVERVVVVGTGPEDWARAIDLADRFEEVFAIVGWHPNYTADYDPATLDTLERQLAHPKVLALGEIGLDYHWDYAPRETQHRALRDQLALGKRLGKGIVFHAREAYADLLDVLEEEGPYAYLFHCFAGNAEEAARGVALGAFFGVDGPITYKKADELRSVIASIPHDRLVVETDAPYMSPVPFRGKPNRPANVAYVNAGLAATLGIGEAACAELTTANARRFFRLP